MASDWMSNTWKRFCFVCNNSCHFTLLVFYKIFCVAFLHGMHFIVFFSCYLHLRYCSKLYFLIHVHKIIDSCSQIPFILFKLMLLFSLFFHERVSILKYINVHQCMRSVVQLFYCNSYPTYKLVLMQGE